MTLILMTVGAFVWFQMYAEPGPSDASAAIQNVLESTGAMGAPGTDPFGALGAFGTVAIASALAMLDSSRRLEELDRTRRTDPEGEEQEDLIRRIHSSQIISLVEFLLTVAAAAFTLVLAFCFIIASKVTLAAISTLLLVLLASGAWRFLLAFDRLTRIQYTHPRAELADRLNLLCTMRSSRLMLAVLWWFTLAALAVGLICHTAMTKRFETAGGGVVGAGIVVSLVAAIWWARTLSRTALFEFGATRAITIAMSVLMSLIPAMLLPFVVFSRVDEHGLDLPPLEGALIACSSVLVVWRTLDQCAVLPAFSSLGFTIGSRIRLFTPVPGHSSSRASVRLHTALCVGAGLGVGVPLSVVNQTTITGTVLAVTLITVLAGGLLTIAAHVRWASPVSRAMGSVGLLLTAGGGYLLIGSRAGTSTGFSSALPLLAALIWLGVVVTPMAAVLISSRDSTSLLTWASDRRHARRSFRYREEFRSHGVSVAYDPAIRTARFSVIPFETTG